MREYKKIPHRVKRMLLCAGPGYSDQLYSCVSFILAHAFPSASQ